MEEKLRKSEERVKAMGEQVRDAEIFLNESNNFHRFLSQDSVGEEKIKELQERLASCKEQYDDKSKVKPQSKVMSHALLTRSPKKKVNDRMDVLAIIKFDFHSIQNFKNFKEFQRMNIDN